MKKTRSMSWERKKIVKTNRNCMAISKCSNSNANSRIDAFNPKLSTNKCFFNKNLITEFKLVVFGQKLFVSGDESKLIALSGKFDISELLSKKHNKHFLHCNLHHECKWFDVDLDIGI